MIGRCKSVFAPGGRGQWAIAPAPDAHTIAADQATLYRTLLAAPTELICRYRADTTIDYVNPAFCEYFGLREADILHRSYQSLIYEADRAAVAQQIAQMTGQNPPVMMEHRVVARGQIRWTRWLNRCWCDAQGAIVGYQSVGVDVTHLQPQEPSLRDREHRDRLLIDTIPQLVWVAEADGLSRVDMNQRWLEFTGQIAEAALGRGWLSVVHPDDLANVLSQWAVALTNGDRFAAAYRLRRADGTYVWHWVNAEPTRDEQGTITHWYGTCTDMSDRQISDRPPVEWERQQADPTHPPPKAKLATGIALTQALGASEARWRRVVDEAPFPILIHAEDGRILQMSQVVTEITGYATEEIPTLDAWTTRVYGDRKFPVLANLQRLYDLDQRVDEGELEVQTRWGDKRIWLFSSAPLGQLSDGTRLVISMAADVTQQKQVEATLAARLRQQAVVTQLSQVALSGREMQTLFDQATRLMVESLSVDYAKVLELQPDGRSLLLRAGAGWQPGIVGTTAVKNDVGSQAGYTLQSQQPIVVQDLNTETRFQGPSLLTEHHVVSGMSTPIPGPNGKLFGVLGAHTTQPRLFTQDDINFLQSVANLLAAAIERKRTEGELNELNQTLEDRVRDRTQALAEVNEELKAFSYSVAHDLRAPLRAIQGFAHVLEADYGTRLDHLGKEYIKRMGVAAEYLDVLIQDLLTYSQLGRAEITLRRVDVTALWQTVLSDLAPAIQACSAHITITGDRPQVYAQQSILRQVFNNLLSNALKFVAPGVTPQIHIEAAVRPPDPVSPRDRHVRIWIIDNGIGIAPRHQQRIFSPFERLHGVESYPGTGIGLSIVKRAIERMGGEVGVESVEHQGSRFWVELPQASDD